MVYARNLPDTDIIGQKGPSSFFVMYIDLNKLDYFDVIKIRNQTARRLDLNVMPEEPCLEEMNKHAAINRDTSNWYEVAFSEVIYDERDPVWVDSC